MNIRALGRKLYRKRLVRPMGRIRPIRKTQEKRKTMRRMGPRMEFPAHLGQGRHQQEFAGPSRKRHRPPRVVERLSGRAPLFDAVRAASSDAPRAETTH